MNPHKTPFHITGIIIIFSLLASGRLRPVTTVGAEDVWSPARFVTQITAGAEHVQTDAMLGAGQCAVTQWVRACGAPYEDVIVIDTGAVYASVYNGTSWSTTATRFISPAPVTGDMNEGDFGHGLTAWDEDDHTHLLIGQTEATVEGLTKAGIVWETIYDHSTGVWSALAPITSPYPSQYARFGWSLTENGDRWGVGAMYETSGKGAGYIFQKNTNMLSGRLQPISEANWCGQVALKGETALLGCEFYYNGAGFLFHWDGNTWVEGLKLQGDTQLQGYCGRRIALLSNGDALLACPYNDNLPGNGNFDFNGRVFQFDTAGNQIAYFDSPAGGDSNFGSFLAATDEDIFVGAYGDNAVWRYSPSMMFRERISGAGGYFAWSGSANSETLVVGAPSANWGYGAFRIYDLAADTTAPQTSLTSNPPNPSNSTSANFQLSGDDTGGSGVAYFECLLDSGEWATCTSPKSYTGLSDASHTFQVRAVDNSNNRDLTPAAFTWLIDTTSPQTSLSSNPPDPSNNNDASFQFTGDDTGGSGVANFECQLDSGGWSTCASPKNYTGLSNGSHTFQVRAVDNVNNLDLSPASYTWIIDTIAPQTSLISNPPNPTNSTGANFQFSGIDTGGSGVAFFECQLDSGGWSTCTSPKSYPVLSEGPHTFQIRAVDNASNTDASPASYTWFIDTTAPQTSLTSNPPDPSKSAIATFQFTGDDTGGSGIAYFECKLDGGGWSTCSSPKSYSGLSDGTHTFQVRAVDSANNADATPVSYSWTIITHWFVYLPVTLR